MAIYTTSKSGIGGIYPENVIDSELQRLEPIVGPEQIKNRHLFGLSLASQMRDPITGKAIIMSDEVIKDIIEGAISQVELECKIDISPVQRRLKFPFDRNLYENFGHLKLPNRPVASLDKLSVTPANQQDVYIVPNEWIEMSHCVRGLIHIVPMTAAFVFGGAVPSATSGGSWFLNVLGSRGWVPAFWQAEFTTGYPGAQIPRVLNELIGTIAAQEILSMLAATYGKSQSHSLGIDGMSQAASSPGPQIFKNRFEELEQKHLRLSKRIKMLYGHSLFSGTI